QRNEEVAPPRRDLRVDRKQAEVLIRPRGRGVVIAGSDMRVPVQLTALTSDDECRLGVDLQVREPVDDVDAGLLQRVRPADVPALVEACLQFDKTNPFFPCSNGLYH